MRCAHLSMHNARLLSLLLRLGSPPHHQNHCPRVLANLRKPGYIRQRHWKLHKMKQNQVRNKNKLSRFGYKKDAKASTSRSALEECETKTLGTTASTVTRVVKIHFVGSQI